MAYEKLRSDRLLTAHRKGDGSQIQMFGGGATVTGNAAVYDSAGNLIDGGAPGGSTAYHYVSACWVLARGADAVVGTNLANPIPICLDAASPETAVEFLEAHAVADEGPAGADFIIDINLNGSSLFGAAKLVIPNTSPATTGMVSQDEFTSPSTYGARGDLLTVDIDQIGSTIPGKDITVVLRMRY